MRWAGERHINFQFVWALALAAVSRPPPKSGANLSYHNEPEQVQTRASPVAADIAEHVRCKTDASSLADATIRYTLLQALTLLDAC